MCRVAQTDKRLLAQLLGDGVDTGTGSCLQDEGGLAHEFGTLGALDVGQRRRGVAQSGRRSERRFYRVTGQRMDEPVIADVTDPIEQTACDRLINERKAMRGFVERRRDEHQRELPPDDSHRLHQPATAGGDAIEPRTDDIEHGGRQPVRTPCAVGHRAGDLADEQRVAAGEAEGGASVGGGLCRSPR